LSTNIKISLYWKCQFIGWSVAALYWSFVGWTGGSFNPWLAVLQFVTDVLLCVWITNLYRNFVQRRRWSDLPLNLLVKRIVPAILVMGILYTVVTVLKVYIIRVLFINLAPQSLVEFFKLNGTAIFVGGIRLMSIWLLAYHFYQHSQRENRLALSFKEAQLNNLHAQLNPHFLFNSLNTIKSLVAVDPRSARRGIDLLSELLRSGLYQRQSMLTNLGSEMNLVKDYLELEKMRMEERLQYRIDMDDTDEILISTAIPRMSVQTLAENAVKHGISGQKEGGLIHIKIVQQDNWLQIRVCNPGSLKHSNDQPGIGLQNLKERISMIYQTKATFELSGNNDGLVCAELNFPLL
jgi:two-component system, LytTR family, sensor histidine kinase AlgZ